MLDLYTTILAPNPSMMTGEGTNTIIVGYGVEGATVIDPAVDDPIYLEALIKEGEKRGRIRRILITHGHPDHIGGAMALRAHLGVYIYAFSREGLPFADEVIPDGMTVPAGDDTLRAIHTPGHRFDHLCFYLENKHTLFAGDLIAGSGTVVIIPPEGDMGDYLNSLERLRQLDISEIVPSHGPRIDDPRRKIAEYIEHRLHREHQIIDVVESMPHGIDIASIVVEVYKDVDPRLYDLAGRSVEAHLLKLARENRLRREGPDTWSPA